MDNPSESLSDNSSSSGLEDSGEDIPIEEDSGLIQPYAFEPVEETDSDDQYVINEEDMLEESNSGSDNASRLQNKNWCLCTHCQIMDREEESLCCQEVSAFVSKNEEVAQVEQIAVPGCITDNPGFQAVCLNHWVLQAAWNQYRQQYGTKAFEGPEHKKQRHIAYRQLVRWCMGVLGKEIRVPLPSCAVSCIRAHFPPPGLEDDFVFVGFKYADE